MQRLDRLHLEFQFAGWRMLRGLLSSDGPFDSARTRSQYSLKCATAWWSSYAFFPIAEIAGNAGGMIRYADNNRGLVRLAGIRQSFGSALRYGLKRHKRRANSASTSSRKLWDVQTKEMRHLPVNLYSRRRSSGAHERKEVEGQQPRMPLRMKSDHRDNALKFERSVLSQIK